MDLIARCLFDDSLLPLAPFFSLFLLLIDHRSYTNNLSSCEIKASKKIRPERDSNPWPLRYRTPRSGPLGPNFFQVKRRLQKWRKKHLLRLGSVWLFFFLRRRPRQRQQREKHARRIVWVCPVFQQEARRAHGQYQNLVRELSLGDREYYQSS